MDEMKEILREALKGYSTEVDIFAFENVITDMLEDLVEERLEEIGVI